MSRRLTGKYENITRVIIIKSYIIIKPFRSNVIVLVYGVREGLVFLAGNTIEVPGILMEIISYERTCSSKTFDFRILLVNCFFKGDITWSKVYTAAFPLLVSDCKKFKIKAFRMAHCSTQGTPLACNRTVCKFYQIKCILNVLLEIL